MVENLEINASKNIKNVKLIYQDYMLRGCIFFRWALWVLYICSAYLDMP